jgi:hypothetical protein
MRVSLDVAMAKPGPVPTQIVTLAHRLRQELDQVDRLLESFLTLAQSQLGPPADESTLDLADLASLAIERHSREISRMSLAVDGERCAEARVNGSETLLSRLVDNVIDNAISHNQRGGWVRVRTSVEGPFARIVVENGGSVLDQKDVDQLARPFRRLGPDRTGSAASSGLGLSIVASIAQVHGGTLELRAISDGGLQVTVALPLAGAPAVEARA